MKFPNKITPYKKSVISKFPLILSALETKDYTVLELYRKLESRFEGLPEYMDTMDCLFYLGKLELLPGGVKLHYVKGNTL